MSYRKRKHWQRTDTYNNQPDQLSGPSSARVDPSLFIVAHEADIIRGPQAARAADSLEVGINVDGQGGSRVGDGLIKLESGAGEGREMWVDRYDARLLLDALPTLAASASSLRPSSLRADSPGAGGWSDLPSDAEDTFFLTPSETDDLHRTKRLRHLDALRTARLRALSPSATTTTTTTTTTSPILQTAGDTDDPWGDSDEEPDESQMELMRRTASHVARATNDAQLRARILAHHGADPRFAFLRGRWGRAWARAQAGANRDMREEREAQSAGALGGLTGYGSGSGSGNGSDDDTGGDDGDDAGGGGGMQVVQEAQPQAEGLALRTAQEARRAKAREWAEKRRAAKALALATDSGQEDQRADVNSN